MTPDVAQLIMEFLNFYSPCRHLVRPTKSRSNGHSPPAASSLPVAPLLHPRMLAQIGLRD